MASLKPIKEEINSDDEIDIKNNNSICIEVTFFADTLPSIKSYYILSKEEYDSVRMMHLDLYLENFINEETLSKDKLDIHIITNIQNIELITKFLDRFGNPFDILLYINEKKNNVEHKSNSNIKSKNKNKLLDIFESNKDTETDSDDYINTMTEIIDSYNKNAKLDEEKLIKLSLKNPEILNDNIINEIKNTN
jgi:hypothetical protein